MPPVITNTSVHTLGIILGDLEALSLGRKQMFCKELRRAASSNKSVKQRLVLREDGGPPKSPV